MIYPHCHARLCLVDSPDGPRVSLNALHASFTTHDRAWWYSQSTNIPHDTFGLVPDAVEAFLAQLDAPCPPDTQPSSIGKTTYGS